MANNVFTSLADIRPFKTSWRIQVKIVHTWKQYTQYTGETIEMILADASGTLIHATVKKPQVNKFQSAIEAGAWRVIENFTLSKSMGKYRATKHAFKMSLMNTSIITHAVEISQDIFLDLASFDEIIADDGLNDNVLIDVLGQVINLGTIKITDMNNNKTIKRLEVELRDAYDQRVTLTLWGKFAETMWTACENKKGCLVTCLIRFAKINIFQGVRTISNAFDMSLLIVDSDEPAVQAFVASLPPDDFSLVIQESRPEPIRENKKKDYFNHFERNTISELLDVTDEGIFRIMCTIYAIDMDFGFYYFTCNKCSKTVYKVPKKENEKKLQKSLFWCGGVCKENTPKVTPRYKLIVCVMDNTAKTKCMLFDNYATKIVHHTVKDILNGEYDEIQDPTIVPQELANLIGKTFEFLVSVEKDNIHDGNDTYKVGYIEVGTDGAILDNIEESEQQVDVNTIVSNEQEHVMISHSTDLGDVPSTASTTPSSKRPGDSVESSDTDQSSSSKKVCVSTIKDAIEDEAE